MKIHRLFFLLLVSGLASLSITCTLLDPFTPLPTLPPIDLVGTMVVLGGTQTAVIQPSPNPTLASPAPKTGSLSGKLSYPSEGIPVLDVVAFRMEDGTYYHQSTAPNQPAYRFDNLVPGTYHVLAYKKGSDVAGGYTEAVICGLSTQCTDHTLIDVKVTAGQETSGVDPGDWYAPAGAFPANPLAKAGSTGSISGKLSFPSEGIPALRIVAFNIENGKYYAVEIAAGAKAYQIKGLPAGSYQVVAYTLDGSLSGGYSQAVLCGLSENCTDHSLIDVSVEAGQNTPDINPDDWFAPPGSFPADPLAPPLQPGSISGKLSYPGEGIPPLRVVAFNLSNGQYSYVDTAKDQKNYQIKNLPAGSYYVVAYYPPLNLAGGYSQFVLCGLQASCTDHSLVKVTVTAGQETTQIDPADWYAPPGFFPANPAP